MPYSDPKKKKAYMDSYNKKYYSNNSINIKPRSKINKKQLRKEKHAHGNTFVLEVMIICYYLCLSKTNHGTKLEPILLMPVLFVMSVN